MVRRLPPRRARTFYNLADALVPPGDGPGAGDVDLVPVLEARLARPGPRGAARALGLRALLWALEWQARLRGRRRGFSWLSRAERAALWRRWRESRLPPRRRAAAALEALVGELWRERARSPDPSPAQCREGA